MGNGKHPLPPPQNITKVQYTWTTLAEKIQFMRNSIFSGTEQFFLGTQVFASPPDMASSVVWENMVLYKTPKFDGVCGMLYYII